MAKEKRESRFTTRTAAPEEYVCGACGCLITESGCGCNPEDA